MSDDRASRLKRISLGARVMGALEKRKGDDRENESRCSDVTEGSTRSVRTFRGLYMMPEGYDDEEEEEMIAGPRKGVGVLHSAPPGRNAAYIGDGQYVDTSQDASLIVEEHIGAATAAKSLHAEIPGGLAKKDQAVNTMNKPTMRFNDELDQEGTKLQRSSYLDKVPPWRGPGSWGTSSMDNPPRSLTFNPSWSMPPVKGDFTYSSIGRQGNAPTSNERPYSIRGFGLDYPDKTPVEKYYNESYAFGTMWNLNPRNVDEFASQLDHIFRSMGSGVDHTNDKLNSKLNRADLRFDELESDSRAVFQNNAVVPPSPSYYHPLRTEVPKVRIPTRPESVNQRFYQYAR